VATDQFSYLSISPNAAPGPRVDDVAGDLTPPQWGLHTIDVSMALGDLVALVRAQAAAWAAS
jgi:sorbitol-specific phosphotransferase system component IIBC